MGRFLLAERYRLELHWDKVIYDNPGECKFVNARFKGPALQDAARLQENDHIMLDFFSQYIIFVKNVYVGKFSWGGVEYNADRSITLKDAKLTHDTELNKVPKLNDTDYLVIDTSGHEEAMHQYNLLYKTYVIDNNSELYNFKEKK